MRVGVSLATYATWTSASGLRLLLTMNDLPKLANSMPKVSVCITNNVHINSRQGCASLQAPGTHASNKVRVLGLRLANAVVQVGCQLPVDLVGIRVCKASSSITTNNMKKAARYIATAIPVDDGAVPSASMNEGSLRLMLWAKRLPTRIDR